MTLNLIDVNENNRYYGLLIALMIAAMGCQQERWLTVMYYLTAIILKYSKVVFLSIN